MRRRITIDLRRETNYTEIAHWETGYKILVQFLENRIREVML